MSDLEKTDYSQQQRQINIRVNRELQELVQAVADELQISENEAVEELLYSILNVRRIILAGNLNSKSKYEAPFVNRPQIDNRKRRKIDRVALLTVIAFAIGALLAVLYALLAKR
jgi:23S rRNA maturation-related 3'-5' exoribonuclease YhaM